MNCEKQIEGVYENVLRCARQEFLEKGFALASLRDIAKAAGTSTGSIYTRFTDKAGLFRALVEPAAGELKRRFLEIQESFHQFDGPTQQEEMGRYTAHAQEGLFDYIYEHLPELPTILTSWWRSKSVTPTNTWRSSAVRASAPVRSLRT